MDSFEKKLIFDFAEFISSKWFGNFTHSYEFPNSRGSAANWINWHLTRYPKQKKIWSIKSLVEASQMYAWDDLAPISSSICKKNLRNALGSGDIKDLKSAILDIYLWGGVAKKEYDRSRVWVNKSSFNQLKKDIENSLGLLKSNIEPGNEFINANLLMNSSVTKVYSFADSEEKIIIYDGRVGAALGVLAKEFLKSKKINVLPNILDFGWFDNQSKYRVGSRNPSDNQYKFTKLGNTKFHANCMWKTNKLVMQIVKFLSYRCTPLEIERSLFMVGYDIRCANHNLISPND